MDRERLPSAFGDFGGQVWLNCAHQGALPSCAAAEALEAVAWKLTPWELSGERFAGVPRRLRSALGRLVGVPGEDVILANGASYGLHLLANGLPLGAGDEVLVTAGDFPSNILPWLGLRERGVTVRQVRPARFVLQPEEVAASLGPNTRVLCASWVHSFSGFTLDLAAVGSLCRERGVLFIANTTQGLGARPLSLANLPVDAVVNVGWKWLCGPYGTGFCWIRPALRPTLRLNLAYWLTQQTADDLGEEEGEPRLPQGIGARRLDLFAPANFFNFKPFAAAVEFLLEVGLERVEAYDQGLVQRLLDGLDPVRWEVVSPKSGRERSTLVFISHRSPERNAAIRVELAASGVHAALRRGRLRFSPHLYNSPPEIDRALELLARAGR